MRRGSGRRRCATTGCMRTAMWMAGRPLFYAVWQVALQATAAERPKKVPVFFVKTYVEPAVTDTPKEARKVEVEDEEEAEEPKSEKRKKKKKKQDVSEEEDADVEAKPTKKKPVEPDSE